MPKARAQSDGSAERAATEMYRTIPVSVRHRFLFFFLIIQSLASPLYSRFPESDVDPPLRDQESWRPVDRVTSNIFASFPHHRGIGFGVPHDRCTCTGNYLMLMLVQRMRILWVSWTVMPAVTGCLSLVGGPGSDRVRERKRPERKNN